MTAETIKEVIVYAGWAMAGLFAIAGYFNKENKQRESDGDKTASNLINNLKDTVGIQEKTIAKLQADMDAHTKARDVEIKQLQSDLNHLKGRNGLLEELFKGQDPDMQKFFNEAPELLILTKETHELAKNNAEMLAGLTQSMQIFVDKVSNMLPSGDITVNTIMPTSPESVPVTSPENRLG